jgi:hypothetical protein
VPPSPTPTSTPFGYGGGLIAISPFPISRNPSFGGHDQMIGLTAPSLLAAVAMRRGQPLGPATDQEVEDFIFDALDLLPGAIDVDVRCETGRVTLSGGVQHKRVKHDVGEIAWAIPGVNDVQNNVTIASRRRTRSAARESEAVASVSGRKQG